MRKVILNSSGPRPLRESDLVNLLNMKPNGDMVVAMPLRLNDDDEYTPYAIYLDSDLGVWQIVEDENGQQVLVCEKVD